MGGGNNAVCVQSATSGSRVLCNLQDAHTPTSTLLMTRHRSWSFVVLLPPPHPDRVAKDIVAVGMGERPHHRQFYGSGSHVPKDAGLTISQYAAAVNRQDELEVGVRQPFPHPRPRHLCALT